VKFVFGHVIFEIHEWTDRHTDTKIAILRTYPGAKKLYVHRSKQDHKQSMSPIMSTTVIDYTIVLIVHDVRMSAKLIEQEIMVTRCDSSIDRYS